MSQTLNNSRVGVLLIHGLTGRPAEMNPVRRLLSARGYRVEAPLLPGHGAGHKELLATNWRDWLKGAQEAFDKLAKECEQVYVCGLCASAPLALLLAAEESASGLVLLSTHFGKFHPKQTWKRHLLPLVYPFPFLRRRLYWTEEPPYGVKDARLQQFITMSLQSAKRKGRSEYGTFRTYVESFHQCELLVEEAKRQASRVKCPALVVHSLEDTWFGVDNAVAVAEALGSNDKTVMLINGCDHVITIDLRKNDIARHIESFVSSVAQRTLAPALGEKDLKAVAVGD